MDELNTGTTKVQTRRVGGALEIVLLVVILFVGGYLRTTGLSWGENTYMHPDERFLLFVGSAIDPVESWREYWDTDNSRLNPHNRGHQFYVYGTLPMFLTRYLVEWVYGQNGMMEVQNIGRLLSALFDLGTVFLVFLTASHLFGRRVGLLATAFSAFTVLQIQHAHFFTLDSFTTFFGILTLYFAVRVAHLDHRDLQKARLAAASGWFSRFISHPFFLLSLGFGIALGMAAASKVNSGLLAVMLPVAMLIQLSTLSPEKRVDELRRTAGYLVLAAVASLFVFRIFQPYAFTGPGFFGIWPNMAWIENLRSLSAQASGDVDFPPAIQWARRPVWFSWQNMVLWGMGLPLGLLAWGGFLVAAREMIKGRWRKHAILWGWTALYFTWQSLIFNPSMRYQLLVYPTLVIFAAWLVVWLYDRGRELGSSWKSSLAIGSGALVLFATATYAFAFTGIYTQPFSRAEASRWIYQNLPGPVNLRIQTEEGTFNQPLHFPYGYAITPDLPYHTQFRPRVDGSLAEIYIHQVQDLAIELAGESLSLTLSPYQGGVEQPVAGALVRRSVANPHSDLEEFIFRLDRPFQLIDGEEYAIQFSFPLEYSSIQLCGPVISKVHTTRGMADQTLFDVEGCVAIDDETAEFVFVAGVTGSAIEVWLNDVVDERLLRGPVTLDVILTEQADTPEPSALGSITVEPFPYPGTGAQGVQLKLDREISLSKDKLYDLDIVLGGEGGAITLSGTALANEGAWDDSLPLRLDGYDGFGGIYQQGLNFDMYETDNPSKLARYLGILDQAEYIVISSSRQWGSLPRIPERFPMNTEYYRQLIGCPLERSIEWCYNVARPGDFEGQLGFELVEVFHSKPTLGPWSVNTQFAEEAFTVYDHPKVFVFRKTPDYDGRRVRAILGDIDLTKVIHLTPKKASQLAKDMMLPPEGYQLQQQSGTWSQLFDREGFINRYPGMGVVLWYAALAGIGLVAYPIVRIALGGLPDKGYPLARITGLLLLSYMVWLAGSLKIPFTGPTITAVAAILAIAAGLLAYRQREELRREWRTKRGYFLTVEGLFLAFFLFGLLLRLGNPDLWHPWKGGEKPMDFSYFNAVLKSVAFPPYDPWFGGGYINYYYYGFVLVGVLVKWIGMVPSIAINLVLPTLFSFIAMGAFSIGWNLFKKGENRNTSEFNLEGDPGRATGGRGRSLPAFVPALAAAIGMALFGNLGTVRMIYHGFQRLAAPGGAIGEAGVLTQWVWAVQGFLRMLGGENLPYSLADWYWIPSRVIPPIDQPEPITEFPFFTVLYADPHAHLFALPLTLLALAWAISVIQGKMWKVDSKFRLLNLELGLGMLVGGLVIGSLRPTNTWDLPTYLALGVLAVGYTAWRYACSIRMPAAWFSKLSRFTQRVLITSGVVLLLIGLTLILFQPYAHWYVQGYTAAEWWAGARTPLWSYLTHWGVFLFVLVSWMVWETREWMANTPLSALRKLTPYRGLIQVGLVALLAWVVVLLVLKVWIAWLVLPLAAWAAVLMLRPELPDAKRVVLFLVATGLMLTLMVEVVVLRGDIGRMNTVFKFYLQVWTLFAVSAGVALGWLWVSLSRWNPSWRNAWQVALVMLVAGGALYPLTGGAAKIRDRMALEAPRTLDGMEYMAYATYHDLNTALDLSEDYRAIRWMQENVQGSPVIVEANMPEYRWGTRYTIYTGLPNVVGWNWHQRQQRAQAPAELVWDRVTDVNEFYLTTGIEDALSFLRRYNVKYIILGQLERAYYPGEGLRKFETYEGQFWEAVYRDGDTVIYRVKSDRLWIW